MKSILTLLITSFSIACFGQGYNLKDFVEIPPGKNQRAEWIKLPPCDKVFKTEIVKGKLYVTDALRSSTPEYVLPDGKLLAINVGEFGGMLFYQPNDTTQQIITINGNAVDTLKNSSKRYYARFFKNETIKNKLKHKQFEVHGGNIGAFFKYRDSLYFVEGLAHMSQNDGAIYKVDLKKSGGTIAKVLSLDNAPQSILSSGDFIYLATFSKFYAFRYWKKELELTNLFWEGLYPNNLVMMDKNTLYAAVYGGYAKIELKEKRITAYKYVGTAK